MTFKIVLLLIFMTACSPPSSQQSPAILLFNGTGTTASDVTAIEKILESKHLSYRTANSRQLNSMSEGELQSYQLLIVPGGNYITIGENLSEDAAVNVRSAVRSGLNYLGICAGALLAGNAPSNSFNLTGVHFTFYSAVNANIHKAAVLITDADGKTIEHYWEDGPQFTGWGEVVAKYPDSTPAVVQGTFGNGRVVLCGTHPEAPENWTDGMTFTMPAGAANAYAGRLIEATLNRTSLPHF